MASIIPDKISPSPVATDGNMKDNSDVKVDCQDACEPVLFQIKSVDSDCVESLINVTKDNTITSNQETELSGSVNIEDHESLAEEQQHQPTDDSSNKVTVASSPTASSTSSSSSTPHNHGNNHSQNNNSSYPSYYPSYHSSYYYPPGAYYPPPPTHGGHQPYSHYYAHYPPPPGAYYPPPVYHYYPQSSRNTPEPSFAHNSSTVTTKGKKPKDSNSCPRTASSIPYSKPVVVKGPYSAFSSTKNKTASKSSSPAPQNSKQSSSKQQQLNIISKKRKQAPIPNNTIFRNDAPKKSKKLAAESKAVAAEIAAERAKTKELEKQELPQTVLDRRQRKNAQSRMRAQKLKQRILEIQEKDPIDRSEEEIMTLRLFEERRQKKNGRSRERAVERKKEYERIMSIPESDWTEEEKNFVQETIVAKFKKNEGDRLRRKKLKEEFDSSASTISSDWESTKQKVSLKMNTNQVSRKKCSSNGIPAYVDSINNSQQEVCFESQTLEPRFQALKDAPLTPISQKEVYSLLESTPVNFFGSTSDPNCQYLSPNFAFNSPSRNFRDLSATMDAIDFDSLELPTDGASILDSSMALPFVDGVFYSPNVQNNHDRHHHVTSGDFNIPQLSPINLSRRSNSGTIENFGHNILSGGEYDIPDMKNSEESTCSEGSKPIAVSFSVDTA